MLFVCDRIVRLSTQQTPPRHREATGNVPGGWSRGQLRRNYTTEPPVTSRTRAPSRRRRTLTQCRPRSDSSSQQPMAHHAPATPMATSTVPPAFTPQRPSAPIEHCTNAGLGLAQRLRPATPSAAASQGRAAKPRLRPLKDEPAPHRNKHPLQRPPVATAVHLAKRQSPELRPCTTRLAPNSPGAPSRGPGRTP